MTANTKPSNLDLIKVVLSKFNQKTGEESAQIADEDLKLRGPGDFFGSRQHGLPELKIADMMTDGEAIRETHAAAEALLKKNPALEGEEYKLLRNAVNRLFSGGISMN